VPEYIDLGPAEGWHYLHLLSPHHLPVQVHTYMLYHLRLFSPRRLLLQRLLALTGQQLYESDDEYKLEDYGEYASDGTDDLALQSMQAETAPAIRALHIGEPETLCNVDCSSEQSEPLAQMYALRTPHDESVGGTPTDKALYSTMHHVTRNYVQPNSPRHFILRIAITI
jgi:hypothetical protein